MADREKEWAAYQAWKKDFRGPIYFQHWDQWIAEYGFACWQASRRTALEEAAAFMDKRADELSACGNHTADTMARIYKAEADAIRALATETNNG